MSAAAAAAAVPLDEFLTSQFQASGLKDVSSGRAFLYGGAAALTALAAAQVLRPANFFERAKLAVFAAGRAIPPVRAYIEQRVNKEVAKIRFKEMPGRAPVQALPAKGLSHAEVLSTAKALRAALDDDYHGGHLSGTVYHGGDDLTKLLGEIMCEFVLTNPLHVESYGSVRTMEAEVVAMCVDMFNGQNEDACGAVTSGGTDSICMAIKSHREYSAAKRGIAKPNLVCPSSAHPAFDKACHYFGIEKITVPVDEASGMCDPALLESYITEDTIAIVGSAVNYPYGTADDIQAYAQIAEKHGCGLHVDCCLGGFVLQFLEEALKDDPEQLAKVPIVDFRVQTPGSSLVMTISCDTHKFGFASKGSSVVLFNSRELRRCMYFAIASWPGGLYASPGYNGSRPGNIIAACWASMMAHGREGYVEAARKVHRAMKEFANGISAIPTMAVIGHPKTSVVSFRSDALDLYELASNIKKNHGYQVHTLQFPAALQFSLTYVHTNPGIIAAFVEAVRVETMKLLEENKERKAQGLPLKKTGDAVTMYGTQTAIPDRTVVNQSAHGFFDRVLLAKQPPPPPEEKPKEGETAQDKK